MIKEIVIGVAVTAIASIAGLIFAWSTGWFFPAKPVGFTVELTRAEIDLALRPRMDGPPYLSHLQASLALRSPSGNETTVADEIFRGSPGRDDFNNHGFLADTTTKRVNASLGTDSMKRSLANASRDDEVIFSSSVGFKSAPNGCGSNLKTGSVSLGTLKNLKKAPIPRDFDLRDASCVGGTLGGPISFKLVPVYE